MSHNITSDTDIDSLIKDPNPEAIRSSEWTRYYLERWARGMADQELRLEFTSDTDDTALVDYTSDPVSVQIPSWEIPQPATEIDRPAYDLLMQQMLTLHEIGHLRYTDEDAAGLVVDSVPDEHRDSFRQFWNALEDGAIEEQLRRDFSVAPELGIMNANYLGEPTGDCSILDAVLISCLDLGVYDTGTLRRLADSNDDTIEFGTEEDRTKFTENVFDLIVETLREVRGATDAVERAKAAREGWKDIEPYIDSTDDQSQEFPTLGDQHPSPANGDAGATASNSGTDSDNIDQRLESLLENIDSDSEFVDENNSATSNDTESDSEPTSSDSSTEQGEVSTNTDSIEQPEDIDTENRPNQSGGDSEGSPAGDDGDSSQTSSIDEASDDGIVDSQSDEMLSSRQDDSDRSSDQETGQAGSDPEEQSAKGSDSTVKSDDNTSSDDVESDSDGDLREGDSKSGTQGESGDVDESTQKGPRGSENDSDDVESDNSPTDQSKNESDRPSSPDDSIESTGATPDDGVAESDSEKPDEAGDGISDAEPTDAEQTPDDTNGEIADEDSSLSSDTDSSNSDTDSDSEASDESDVGEASNENEQYLSSDATDVPEPETQTSSDRDEISDRNRSEADDSEVLDPDTDNETDGSDPGSGEGSEDVDDSGEVEPDTADEIEGSEVRSGEVGEDVDGSGELDPDTEDEAEGNDPGSAEGSEDIDDEGEVDIEQENTANSSEPDPDGEEATNPETESDSVATRETNTDEDQDGASGSNSGGISNEDRRVTQTDDPGTEEAGPSGDTDTSDGNVSKGQGSGELEPPSEDDTEDRSSSFDPAEEDDVSEAESEEDAWTEDIASEPNTDKDVVREFESLANRQIDKHEEQADRMAEELEELQDTLDEVDDIFVRDLQIVDGPDDGTYRSGESSKVRKESRRLSNILRRQLQQERRSDYRHDRRQGDLDTRVTHRLALHDFKVFREEISPEEKDYDAVFVLDRSGSMQSDMKGAERATATLLTALEEIDIDTCLIDMYQSEPRVAKPFGVDVEGRLESILTGDNGGGTPLSPCLELAREHLRKRDTHPFLVVVTDGRPKNEQRYQRVIKRTNFPVLGVYLDFSAHSLDQIPDSILESGNLFHRRKIITSESELLPELRSLCQDIMF